jgi:thiol-disulfide isomerase/thioredoxin
MEKARAGAGLIAACLTLCGGVGIARAQFDDFKVSPDNQPSPEKINQILSYYRPTQEGVVYSKPTPEEAKACTLKLLVGARKGSTGYLLLDPQGRPLRRFLDRNGDTAIDVWCYYKDGVEVYREMAVSTSNNPDDLPKAPNHFRWLNAGGTKWGIDLNKDGKIDYWKAISPEEVAQEVFQAVVTRNSARLQALFISEAEARYLKLSAAEAKRIAELQKQAPAKFQKTLESLANLTAKANFVRVESAPPECVPADSTDPDLIHYASRSILYENAGKHDWLQTGEMIQVGRAAWRLVDAPTAGDVPAPVEDAKGKVDPQLQKLFEQVSALDAKAPAPEAPKAEVTRYNQERVGLVQQILPKLTDAKDRETWTKQLADNLSTLAQADDKGAFQRLVAMKDDTVKTMAGSNLAGYLHYRVLWTEFAPKLIKVDSKDAAKVQEQWLAELAKYVQAYPKADDTPDALIQLAVGSEFAGKDDEAKRWYQQIPANFPDNPMAPKAAGAIKRLELAGKPMELSGTTTAGKAFDLKSLSGKVVVVYYWASNCEVCAGDFARIKQMLQTHGPKGLEFVTVNLDDRPAEASKYLQATPVPGTHLVQPAAGPAGGLVGPLATQYGINGLPSMFLVGKDGKVISTKLQMGELEEAVRKAL